MTEHDNKQALETELFSGHSARVFTILDGASVSGLPAKLTTFKPEYASLYQGDLKPDMAEVAPYLVILEKETTFTDWVLTNGWGRHWGIFGTADADLSTLREHFRKFVMVNDKSGRALYFRFYDPRVWQAYLPTLDEHNLKTVFGSVSTYLLEDRETRNAWEYRLTGKVLQRRELKVG